MIGYPATVLFAQLSLATAQAIIIVWLFAMGGAVGSFLNVVIYRVPLGKSLVFPGSHCPICEHPIRWHDNVPIFGWIFLWGRCRDCRARISIRYPIVEALVAGLFVLLGVVEGLSGGGNLPLQPVMDANGFTFPPLSVGLSAWIMGYHLLVLCTLLALAFVEYDGQPVPPGLFWPALVVGVSAPMVWPVFHPASDWLALNDPAAATVDGITGFGLGLLLGAIIRRVGRSKASLGVLLGTACVGLFLGLKAIAPVAAAAILMHLAFSALRQLLPRLPAIPYTAWLFLATLAWLVTWGQVVAQWPLLG